MAGGNHGIPHSLLLNHVIEDKWLDVRPTPKSSNKLSNMSDGSWKVESCTLHEQEYYLREATEILRSAKKQRF